MTETAPEDLVADVLKRFVDERLEFLIVECSPYFVQFAAPHSAGQVWEPEGPLWDLYAEHGLYAEAVSDVFLEPEDQLGIEGAERLSRLGWTAPVDDSNWTRLYELRGPQDCVLVARGVLATFVDGFHAAGQLQYQEGDRIPSAGTDEQSEISVPTTAMAAGNPPARPQVIETVVPQASPAAPSPSSTRPANSRNVAGTVGIARSVSKGVGPYRGKPAALQVLTFRLETYDENDNPGPLLGVEMRGTEIVGTLENGDWVLITERVKPGEGCRPKEVQNLTTSERVRSKRHFFMAQ